MFTYDAMLLRVVDGDTVDLLVDLGFHVHIKVRTRFIGVDTPERGDKGYAEAAKFTQSWFGERKFSCTIRSHGKDSFGRWLVTVMDPHPASAKTLNDALIETGHARVYEQ